MCGSHLLTNFHQRCARLSHEVCRDSPPQMIRKPTFSEQSVVFIQPISGPTLLSAGPIHAIADDDVGPMFAFEKNLTRGNRDC